MNISYHAMHSSCGINHRMSETSEPSLPVKPQSTTAKVKLRCRTKTPTPHKFRPFWLLMSMAFCKYYFYLILLHCCSFHCCMTCICTVFSRFFLHLSVCGFKQFVHINHLHIP